jgi:hypothetical protein
VDLSPTRQPNPEAIAWYLARTEQLLGDIGNRVQTIRSRGGPLAGFLGGRSCPGWRERRADG